MRFNKTNVSNELSSENYHSRELVALDTVTIDDHSRFTFTKRLKRVFPVQQGDSIAAYYSRENEEIIFNLQRGGSVIGTWICKKSDSIYERNYYKANRPESEYEKHNNLRKQGIHNADIPPNQAALQPEHIPNIAIVDDEEDLLYSFEMFLKERKSLRNAKVDTFKSSQEALLRFTEYHYDLVIIDVRMPGINGIELYKIMRSIRPDFKVLFISALESAQEFITMLPGIRSSDIIKKPIEMEHFVEKIKDSLNN
jgi:CheY-like chemotaxis protein